MTYRPRTDNVEKATPTEFRKKIDALVEGDKEMAEWLSGESDPTKYKYVEQGQGKQYSEGIVLDD